MNFIVLSPFLVVERNPTQFLYVPSIPFHSFDSLFNIFYKDLSLSRGNILKVFSDCFFVLPFPSTSASLVRKQIFLRSVQMIRFSSHNNPLASLKSPKIGPGFSSMSPLTLRIRSKAKYDLPREFPNGLIQSGNLFVVIEKERGNFQRFH